MHRFAHGIRGMRPALIAAFVALTATSMAGFAATYVYVSNADDSNIGTYTIEADGSLKAGPRVAAANLVMPMAVSPDRKFLYAAIRSRPFSVITYAIDPASGTLKQLTTSPLAESFPYISLDKSGRWLFGASYGGHLISVNAVGADGRVDGTPSQLIPVGRNAHSIRTDESNKFVYVPTLGTDQVFQFTFDASNGRLASNTPSTVMTKAMTGPRHFVVSRDNKFVYVLNELLGTVTTYALDAKTGLLTEKDSVSGVPPDAKLGPGAPRGAVGAPGGPPPRNTDSDIWSADVHMTPDGKFLYMTERTGSTLGAFSVDGATGKLTYLGSTPTEKQPRGFRIDPKGKYLVASGEKSDTISIYAIDGANGSLKALGKAPSGKGANWVEIVSFD